MSWALGVREYSLAATMLRVWRAFAAHTRRLTDSYSRSARWLNIDFQTPQECLELTVMAIDRIEYHTSNSLYFNHSLCKYLVTKYLLETRDLLKTRESEIITHSQECVATLTALLSTVRETEFLIHKHCSHADWVRAAVELAENIFAYAEIILDLKWYSRALNIAIVAATSDPGRSEQNVRELQASAMAEYLTFFEGWESDCKELLQKDRQELLLNLNQHIGPNGWDITCEDQTAELWTSGSYLAKKLLHRDRSAQAIATLNIKVDVPQLHKNRMRLLGKGAYGSVFEVRCLGMQCAMKIIESGQGTAGQEVRILSELHHPNIVQMYGCHVEDGKSYIIMELMDTSLKEHICERMRAKLNSPFPLLVALDIMLQTAKGMRYLHSKGMAHRDLKSANILVKPNRNPELAQKGCLTVKLTDFGMAKANLKYSTFTPLSWTVGTLVWKAPELFRIFHTECMNPGQKHYPFKADVYSYGMVCYEILSGKTPFANVPLESTSSFYAKIKGGDRPDLPTDLIPQDLASYIDRLWDTNPRKRPNFVDICKRLRHFRDSLLQVVAYNGCERTQAGNMLLEDTCTIEEDDFIDTTDWEWVVEYGDIARLEKLHLGGSGFLSVWHARWRQKQLVLAKYIEVTLIDDEASIAAFKLEMEMLVKMRHTNLVHYIGATQRPPFVVVTELLSGVTLRHYLDDRWPLAAPLAVKIALQVALAMASLHEEQVTIIHGELSPDCILVDEAKEIVRVADFGLRKFRKPPAKWHPRSYRAAPEQLRGSGLLHKSADVFAFGMVLHEIFERDESRHFWKRKKVAEEVAHGYRPPLATAKHYPRRVRSLMEKCWSPQYQERPSFEFIVEKLEKTFAQVSKNSM